MDEDDIKKTTKEFLKLDYIEIAKNEVSLPQKDSGYR